jgi:hypothetical protein
MKRILSLILCLFACSMVAACGHPDPVGAGNAIASTADGDHGLATAAVAGVAGYALAKATQPSPQPYAGQPAYIAQRTRYVPVYAAKRPGPTPAGLSTSSRASTSRFSFRPSRPSAFRPAFRSTFRR